MVERRSCHSGLPFSLQAHVNRPFHSARPLCRPPRYPFTGVDHHWKDHLFATSGATVQLWDTSRSECLQSFEWGADTVTSVRFNPAQHSLLCCLSADRGVTMYDVNSGSALQKMTMQTRANAACWNPMVRAPMLPRLLPCGRGGAVPVGSGAAGASSGQVGLEVGPPRRWGAALVPRGSSPRPAIRHMLRLPIRGSPPSSHASKMPRCHLFACAAGPIVSWRFPLPVGHVDAPLHTCHWLSFALVVLDAPAPAPPPGISVGADACDAGFRGPRSVHLRHAQAEPRHLRALGPRERSARPRLLADRHAVCLGVVR
eukprot:scaffold7712_cov119-Isochrysis_galbana.AAC.19